MHIALYMSHLYRKGIAPSTIATKLSAIAYWHQLYFQIDPTAHFMVRRILYGMKKSRPSVSTRPPLTFSDIKKMEQAFRLMNWTPYVKKLLWAMIILSFHAFLRAGEMTKSSNTLEFDQVSVSEHSVKILFRKYKHSKGTPVLIKVRRQSSLCCPVRVIQQYLDWRGTQKGFLFCHADGAPVTYHWYKKHFRQLVLAARLDPELSTHSARIGAATFAAASGISEENIKRMGRFAQPGAIYVMSSFYCFCTEK